MDPGRRAFLKGDLLSAEGRALGPVPPWHRGRAMHAECAACAAPCVGACPERIVRVHPRDHALSGVPYLTFERGGCTWCGACAAACPQGLSRAPRRPKLGRVHLERGSCLSWNGVVCISCASRCVYRAINRDRSGRVTLDAEACTGCGACIAACPVPGALAFQGGVGEN
ncbi:MAG: 4Fe-4S binding protein [Gammaproteobacteria bacterium]